MVDPAAEVVSACDTGGDGVNGCSPPLNVPGSRPRVQAECIESVLRRSPRLLARNGDVNVVVNDDEVDDELAPVLTPVVGMVYPSMEEVEGMYKRYAKSQGFAISRVASSFNSKKERRATSWRCECYGSPELKSIRKANKLAKNPNTVEDVRKELVNPKKRMSKKCHCEAMLYASVNDRKEWVVRTVVLEHKNHNPSPSKVNLVKEYRMEAFSKTAARRLENDFNSGSTVSNIYNCMQNERGGPENTPFLESDLRHVVNGIRKKRMEGGDCNAMVAYFNKMQSDNRDFFYSHRLDSSGMMQDILWVDARSRAAYKEFCDVVCFDTTYLTNAYKLPFANFVGVNHHGQSILFGCALITHEDAETFEWVFKQWLIAMDGIAPKGILTDQSAAMRKALEVVMPDTRHRWCIWHITQKLPYKLRGNSRYEEIRDDLLDVVYNSINETDFDRRWSGVIQEYELQSNEWLKNLFDERTMWVPSFMSDYFWAGMRSTQRVESIHNFFDKFVGPNTMFCEFGEKYIAAVESRIKDEKFADDTNVKCSRAYSTGYAAERMFRKIYTATKFRALQVQCERVTYVSIIEERQLDEKNMEFMAEDRVWVKPKRKTTVGDPENENHKKYNFEVLLDDHTYYSLKFNTESQNATCSCKKFETDGIMCRHLIRLYDKLHIKNIPELFILRRWRKDVFRKHTSIRVAFHDHTRTDDVKRLDRMVSVFDELCDVAAKSETCTKLVLRALRKTLEEVRSIRAQEEKNMDDEFEETNATTSKSIASSNGVPNTSNGTTNGGGTPLGESVSLGHLSHSSNGCPTPTSALNDAVHIDDPPLPKKRGRPRASRFKTLSETGWRASQNSSCPSDCIEGNAVEVVKRKRGRPRKQTSVDTEGFQARHDSPPSGPQKFTVKRKKTVTFSDGAPKDNVVVGLDDELVSRNGVAFVEHFT